MVKDTFVQSNIHPEELTAVAATVKPGIYIYIYGRRRKGLRCTDIHAQRFARYQENG